MPLQPYVEWLKIGELALYYVQYLENLGGGA